MRHARATGASENAVLALARMLGATTEYDVKPRGEYRWSDGNRQAEEQEAS